MKNTCFEVSLQLTCIRCLTTLTLRQCVFSSSDHGPAAHAFCNGSDGHVTCGTVFNFTTAAPAQNERESVDGNRPRIVVNGGANGVPGRQTGPRADIRAGTMAVLSVRGGPFQIFSDHTYDVARTDKANGSADRVQAIGASVGIRMTSTEATIRSDKIMALSSRSLWSRITFSELYGHVLVDEIPDLCAKRRQLDLNSTTRGQEVDKLTLACSAGSGWQPHEMLQRRSRCRHLQTFVSSVSRP